MGRVEAEQTLEAVAGLRQRARADVRALWFPLVLFGLLTLLSVLIGEATGNVSGLFWAAAGPAGAVVTAIYYSRCWDQVGVSGAGAAFFLTGVAILVGVFAFAALASALGSQRAAALVPVLIVSAGYIVFAWLERSVFVAMIAVALCLVALALFAAGVSAQELRLVLALVYGVVFVVSGLVYCRAGRGGL